MNCPVCGCRVDEGKPYCDMCVARLENATPPRKMRLSEKVREVCWYFNNRPQLLIPEKMLVERIHKLVGEPVSFYWTDRDKDRLLDVMERNHEDCDFYNNKKLKFEYVRRASQNANTKNTNTNTMQNTSSSTGNLAFGYQDDEDTDEVDAWIDNVLDGLDDEEMMERRIC